DGPVRAPERFERFGEIPFSSERKMMSVLVVDHDQDDQRLLISKGAPDVLLGHCSHVQLGMDVVPLTDELHAQALANVEELSGEGLRTISVPYSPSQVDEDVKTGSTLKTGLIFVGTAGIIDPPREEVAPAIADAHRAGIRVI